MPEIIAAHLERVAKEWYELLKADDPHHFEGYMDAWESGFHGAEPYTFEQFCGSPMVKCGLQAVAAALAACAREAGEIKIGHLLRIIAELRTSAKDFDSMGYGLFACKMQRLAAELEDLTGRERAVGERA